MNILHNSILTVEEQVLLYSLDGKTTKECIEETEYLISVTSVDDDIYPTIVSLFNKLIHGYLDIEKETEFLPDNDDVE